MQYHYNSHRTSLYTMFLVHLSGVKMLNAFSVPTLDSATYSNWHLQIGTWPMHLKICPCTLFMVMAKHVINAELSCDREWAVMRSTASCCPRSDVISELRQRVAVDTLITSTLLWWRHVDTNGSSCCWENWCDPTKTLWHDEKWNMWGGSVSGL
jgi:hypothetical protein